MFIIQSYKNEGSIQTKHPFLRRHKNIIQSNEKVELTVEEPIENKYAPKKKVGSNTRPKNIVNTVGLGKLKVETINGYTDG